jgi:hypothetical protein
MNKTLCHVLWIRNGFKCGLDADPDPGNKTNTDPDPDQTLRQTQKVEFYMKNKFKVCHRSKTLMRM